MKRVVYIALAISLIMNILLIYDRLENAQKLNISWSNSIANLAKPIEVSIISPDLLDKLDEDILRTTNTNLWLLPSQLSNLQSLPDGAEILTFSTMQKVSTVTNYEHELITKIQKNITNSKKISSQDLEQLSQINKAWERTLATLQKEKNEIDPFSPIFRAKQWKTVLEDASKELDGLKLVPLP